MLLTSICILLDQLPPLIEDFPEVDVYIAFACHFRVTFSRWVERLGVIE